MARRAGEQTDRAEQRGTRRSWFDKFADAFRGLAIAVRGQSSCRVHLLATVVVIAVAAARDVSGTEWCLLTLAIAGVWGAELFNSALESLARALDRYPDPHIAAALDMASAAVLVMAAGAAVLGAIVLLR